MKRERASSQCKWASVEVVRLLSLSLLLVHYNSCVRAHSLACLLAIAIALHGGAGLEKFFSRRVARQQTRAREREKAPCAKQTSICFSLCSSSFCTLRCDCKSPVKYAIDKNNTYNIMCAYI